MTFGTGTWTTTTGTYSQPTVTWTNSNGAVYSNPGTLTIPHQSPTTFSKVNDAAFFAYLAPVGWKKTDDKTYLLSCELCDTALMTYEIEMQVFHDYEIETLIIASEKLAELHRKTCF